MARPPAWSEEEDAHLIDLCEQKMMGRRRYDAFHALFPNRTTEAVKQHVQLLRSKRKVR
jgi:hypothetical protein